MMSSVSDSSDGSGHTELTYFQELAYRLLYQLVNRVIKDGKDGKKKQKTQLSKDVNKI